MITSTLVDRASATVPFTSNRLGGCETKAALIVQCRKALQRVQAFVDDARQTHTGLGSLGRTPEMTRQQAERGLGTRGMFTSFAPADLDLYASLVRHPLRMPSVPQVLFQLVDHNTGQEATRYQESFLFIRVNCPDGRDAWQMASVSVVSEIMCIMGLAWGLPKYLADEITIGDDCGEVRYEGDVRLAAAFAPDAAVEERIAGQTFGIGEPAVRFNPSSSGESVLVGRKFIDTALVERTSGWVTVRFGATEPLRPLLPENARFAGAWQRYLPGSWELWKY